MAEKKVAELPPRKLFISNEFVDSTCQHLHDKLTLRNPFDDSLIVDDLQVAGAEDIDLAVSESQKAFRHGPWAKFTGQQRAACLNKLADLIEKNAEKIAYAESLPTGRPIGDIINFDLVHVVQVFRYYAGWADKIAGQHFNADDGFTKLVSYHPLGVCASVASWNVTFAYIGWKLAPALAAGNTAIFKPSEKSPLGVLAAAPLFAEAGFPPGVVQFVTGAAETGKLLASHMKIAKISFTGSIATGRSVQEAANRTNMKRVTLELGGKSAALVFADADFETAVGSVAAGFLSNCGQICVAGSRVLVEESIADKFIEAAKAVFEASGKALGSDPLDSGTKLGPVVDKIQFDRIMSYIEAGKTSATLLTGGKRSGTKGCFIEPTLFLNPSDDSPIWKEEIFGPVLTIKTFKTESEAIEIANDTTYGLAGYVYTRDVTRALRVSAALEAGVISVNSPFVPSINTPFGGMKMSGQGRELGEQGLHHYLEPKTVHISMA